MARGSWWRLLLAVVCVAWFVQKAVWTNTSNQWDFRVYYHSAQSWLDGRDPYDTASLPRDLREDGFKFNYPPYALGVFAPIARLPLERARLVYVALKIVALGCLVQMWSRLLRTRLTEPAWLLFLVFAYSSAIFIDVVSGSVTTFEQCLVWLGVAALAEERYWVYVAAVVGASLFRLTPIVLLLVCLAAPDRRGFTYIACGLAALACVFLLTYAIAPRLTIEFFQSVPKNYGESGRLNPATLPLVTDVAAMIGRSRHVPIAAMAQVAAYLAIAGTVAVATAIAAVRVTNSSASNRLELVVYLVAMAQPLVMPRFKNYSYMLLIPPTFFIATRSTHLKTALPLLLLACLPVYSWITSAEKIALVANYSSWLIALAGWTLFLYEIRAGGLIEYAGAPAAVSTT
jgi:glycosyl transferase family 87